MNCRATHVVVLLALFVLLSACGKEAPEPGSRSRLTVVVTLFPLYDFTRNVAGERAKALLLLPPGVEPHAFEPRPSDVKTLAESRIFIHTGLAMEPWVTPFLKGNSRKDLLVVDASKGLRLRPAGHHHHPDGSHRHSDRGAGEHEEKRGAFDPHVWLDLKNASVMVDRIAAALAATDPENGPFYLKNAATFKEKLEALDKRYSAELERCPAKVFIHGGHYAFGYLADRYGLTYFSAYEGSPNAEPTPRRIMELKRLMSRYDLNYVFYEELITPRMAETLARETGARMLKLHGAHNLTKDEFNTGVTFLGLMEENLRNLKLGLRCP